MTLGHPRRAPADGSFEAFYAETFSRTFKAVLRRAGGDRHVTDDATHDAYVAMLKSWPERKHRSLDENRQYVQAIAANKVFDWYRHQRRYVELDDEFDAATDESGFAEVLDELSVVGEVRALIGRQPLRRRAVGELFFLEEIGDYREIADTLSMAPSTARNHVKRLRDLLKPFVSQMTETGRRGNRPHPPRTRDAVYVKIVIAGGRGAGKTTFISSLSERTAVAGPMPLDFGQVPLDSDLTLCLFGASAQESHWAVWDDLVRDAVGAVLLVDTREISRCFALLDYFEDREMPYVVAVNCFDDVLSHQLDEVRRALAIAESVPVLSCDARNPSSVKQMLLALVETALRHHAQNVRQRS
ncbi:hypothetical protein [Saccharopolyspora taberi]|uniref:Sigma-70 family RNA polymerase sigma factor n=1 Tax=Saccharopolyspora taberi TaxID=60895 RepID=A0ABN3V3X3_9PSEU